MCKCRADPNDLIEQTAKSRAEEQKEKNWLDATADRCGLGCPLSFLRQGVVHVPNSDQLRLLSRRPGTGSARALPGLTRWVDRATGSAADRIAPIGDST